jgi:hypothetical protein
MTPKKTRKITSEEPYEYLVILRGRYAGTEKRKLTPKKRQC